MTHQRPVAVFSYFTVAFALRMTPPPSPIHFPTQDFLGNVSPKRLTFLSGSCEDMEAIEPTCGIAMSLPSGVVGFFVFPLRAGSLECCFCQGPLEVRCAEGPVPFPWMFQPLTWLGSSSTSWLGEPCVWCWGGSTMFPRVCPFTPGNCFTELLVS